MSSHFCVAGAVLGDVQSWHLLRPRTVNDVSVLW